MNTNSTALLVNNPDNISRLTSPTLRKYVSNALSAKTGVNKSMWKYVINMNNIITEELFKDEPLIKTQRALAQAMDDKESNLSKYVGAIDCVTNKLPEYGYDMTNITYSNAYLLSTIEDLPAFMEEYKETNFSKIGKNQLERLISLYKRPKDEAIEVTANDEEEPAGDEVEEEKEAKANKGDITANITKGILTFTYRAKRYSIPMKDLKDYITEIVE